MLRVTVLLVVVTLLGRVLGQPAPPCGQPTYSQVQRRGETTGSITVRDPGGSVDLYVLLYTAKQLSSTQYDYGRLDYFSTPRQTGNLRFFVRLPSQHPVSEIGKITVNGKVICQSAEPQNAEVLSTSVYSYTLPRRRFAYKITAPKVPTRAQLRPTPEYMAPTDPPRPITQIDTNKDVCGTSLIPRSLIFGGNRTRRGAWPWIVPLLHRNQFICGSTLISKKHVITAAHCVFHPITSKQLNTEDFQLDVGKFDLSKSDEGGNLQVRKVRRTIVHEEFNHTSLRNDIAILLLDKDVQFSAYIGPICLWSMDTALDYIVGKKATVVGWGLTEARRISNKPLQAQVPIVSQEVCHGSNEAFVENADPERSICAGSRMGVGPCQGDSGSGLFLQDTDSNGRLRWFLRGIVSFNVPGNRSACNLDGYSLFTDVSKYASWINEEMQSS